MFIITNFFSKIVLKIDLQLKYTESSCVACFYKDKNLNIVFQATVLIVYHATAIFPGFQTTVHVGNVRQTCVIEGIMDANDRGLQTNDTASVLFRFVSHPEYLHVGMRLLFREGRTKGIGKITQIFPVIGSQNSIK